MERERERELSGYIYIEKSLPDGRLGWLAPARQEAPCTPLSALLQVSACRRAGLLSSLWHPSLLSSLLFSIKMEDSASDVRSLRVSLRAMKKEKEELERSFEEEQEAHRREQESQRKLLDALRSAGVSELLTATYRGSRHIAHCDYKQWGQLQAAHFLYLSQGTSYCSHLTS